VFCSNESTFVTDDLAQCLCCGKPEHQRHTNGQARFRYLPGSKRMCSNSSAKIWSVTVARPSLVAKACLIQLFLAQAYSPPLSVSPGPSSKTIQLGATALGKGLVEVHAHGLSEKMAETRQKDNAAPGVLPFYRLYRQ